MKSRPLLFLFCSLALVHLVAQFAMLYALLAVCDQDEDNFQTLKYLDYSQYLAIITFPCSQLFRALHEPPSLAVARVVIVAIFVLNSALWSGLICSVLWLCSRLFRSRRSTPANQAI